MLTFLGRKSFLNSSSPTTYVHAAHSIQPPMSGQTGFLIGAQQCKWAKLPIDYLNAAISNTPKI